ncbi:hypothetical protein HMSSN036_42390 [Paenibacillus macerans]|nr:hypothetical protein HMSSN036_42390 [Paenibacillus macerans]
MMDKDYGRWLKEMEADSRAKQEQFMNRIAGRLKRPRLQEAPQRALRERRITGGSLSGVRRRSLTGLRKTSRAPGGMWCGWRIWKRPRRLCSVKRRK